MRVEALFAFMQERHAIAVRRAAGKPKPWTKDKILQAYRFCNIYRELDTVTQWLAENWRKPHADDPELWFAMAVARFINWPDTMEEVGYPVPYTKASQRWLKTAKRRFASDEQVYNGAYTISTNGMRMIKHEYLDQKVFKPLWNKRDIITSAIANPRCTLSMAHAALSEFQGVGSFMAAQIIADLKYVQLRKASDWWTWAAPGPGSRRGLNRVCELPVEMRWRGTEWKGALDLVYERVAQMCAAAEMPRLHAQDLQNSLCEFDKYERVRLGEGRTRSLYPGLPGQ